MNYKKNNLLLLINNENNKKENIDKRIAHITTQENIYKKNIDQYIEEINKNNKKILEDFLETNNHQTLVNIKNYINYMENKIKIENQNLDKLKQEKILLIEERKKIFLMIKKLEILLNKIFLNETKKEEKESQKLNDEFSILKSYIKNNNDNKD